MSKSKTKKAKVDEVSKFKDWLRSEINNYNSGNPFGMKIVVDDKQVVRRIRALVRKTEYNGFAAGLRRATAYPHWRDTTEEYKRFVKGKP